jgi:tRNA(Glu) U13 pseudouridine synthase TruD
MWGWLVSVSPHNSRVWPSRRHGMATVNIDPTWFLYGSPNCGDSTASSNSSSSGSAGETATKRCVRADIKVYPDDFFVKEIESRRDNDDNNDSSTLDNVSCDEVLNDLCISENELATLSCVNAFTKSSATKKQLKSSASSSSSDGRQDDFSINNLISDDELECVKGVNNWLQEQVCERRTLSNLQSDRMTIENVAVGAGTACTASCALSRRYSANQKVFLLRYLRREFPCVEFIVDKSNNQTLLNQMQAEAPQQENTDNSSDGITTFTIVVKPCLRFEPLLAFGLSFSELLDLYAYFNNGPSDPNARRGVSITTPLSKEGRTMFHATIRRICPSFESSTASEDKNRKQNYRANKRHKTSAAVETAATSPERTIQVCWTDRALAKASQRATEGNTEAGNSSHDTPSNGVVWSEVVLGFILFKRDKEQQAAIQQVAELCHVSPSNINTCGIKDKRAVTFQRCSITIRANCPYCTSSVGVKRTRDSDDVAASSHGQPDKCSLRAVVLSTIQSLLTLSYKRFIADGDSLIGKSMEHACCPDGSVSIGSWKPAVAVGDIRLLSNPVNIGDLWGNQFKIVLRNLSPAICGDTNDNFLNGVVTQIKENGFPNFYGSQRMGYSRFIEDNKDVTDSSVQTTNTEDTAADRESGIPTGPRIGFYFLMEQYELALHTIILDSLRSNTHYFMVYVGILLSMGSHTSSSLAMQSVKIEYNKIFNNLPTSATRCRMCLKAMIRQGFLPSLLPSVKALDVPDSVSVDNLLSNDISTWTWHPIPSSNQTQERQQQQFLSSRDVLMQIPHSVRSLWVSAYQSWLWNKAVSMRLAMLGPLALAGDLVFDKDDQSVSGDDAMVPHEEADADIGQEPASQQGSGNSEVRHLTEAELADMTEAQRRRLLRHVVMPLFGSKILLPTNEPGRCVVIQRLSFRNGKLHAYVMV